MKFQYTLIAFVSALAYAAGDEETIHGDNGGVGGNGGGGARGGDSLLIGGPAGSGGNGGDAGGVANSNEHDSAESDKSGAVAGDILKRQESKGLLGLGLGPL